MPEDNGAVAGAQLRAVPVDWEALEDAFENNAPEVHSYLHLLTGEVLRIVDGVADPQMHARIAADPNYLRIDPVSSREQYRWMERYIPMVEDAELRAKLAASIDGKGAFRRFKDVLMAYGAERERWFAFRSERLRIFMEAWLNAHSLKAVARPTYVPEVPAESPSSPGITLPAATESEREAVGPISAEGAREARRSRTAAADALRRSLRELSEALGPRDLDTLVAFAEFLKARRASRAFAQHADSHAEGASAAPPPSSGGSTSAHLEPASLPPSPGGGSERHA